MSPGLYASVARSFRTAVAAHKGWTVGKGMFVLDVIEVGSWKVEWNGHFMGKNPPSLGLFWWRIAKFLTLLTEEAHQKLYCTDKNMRLDIWICTCIKMQLCGVIMIGNITLKCRSGDKFWSNGGCMGPQLEEGAASSGFSRFISLRLTQAKLSNFIVRNLLEIFTLVNYLPWLFCQLSYWAGPTPCHI